MAFKPKHCKACKQYISDDATICMHCGTDQRKIIGPIWKIISTLVIFVTFIMALNIWKQTTAIKTQTDIMKDSFALEKRPYLYVDIKPKVKGYDENGNFFAGVEITYRNEGLLPANNIKTEMKIGNDSSCKGLSDITEWYEEIYGSYPYVTSVFPKQTMRPVVLTPQIPDFPESNKRYIYFGIHIEYEGFTEDIYHYAVDYVYEIIKTNDLNYSFIYVLLKRDTYCDINNSLPKGKIAPPDWNIYKNSEHAIKKVCSVCANDKGNKE